MEENQQFKSTSLAVSSLHWDIPGFLETRRHDFIASQRHHPFQKWLKWNNDASPFYLESPCLCRYQVSACMQEVSPLPSPAQCPSHRGDAIPEYFTRGCFWQSVSNPCCLQPILRESPAISHRGGQSKGTSTGQGESRGNAHLIQTGLFTTACCCFRADQLKRFPNSRKNISQRR